MKKNRKPYTFFQKAASIFLMMVLIWLTVSTPFIIPSQQELAKQQKALSVDLPMSDSEDESTDSSGNNIEEKVPNSNLSEEFLHEHHTSEDDIATTSQNHKLENSDIYIAFHGELHAPPPNVA